MATYVGGIYGDYFFASNADDSLYGYGGNDTLYGNGGNDMLSGGIGNDYLNGGLGNDTYLFAPYDGTDAIIDDGGTDTVTFSDVASTSVSVSRTNGGYNLQLNYSGSVSQLTVWSYFGSADSRIEQFKFSDGVVWSWTDIKAHIHQTPTSGDDFLYGYDDSNDTLNGLAGTDSLYGYGGNDTLKGGAGNDNMDGGLGDDTYLIAKTDGSDWLSDYGGTDVLKFTNVTVADLTTVSRTNFNDLLLGYGGGNEVRLADYFASASYRVEQIQFSDGTVWGWDDIKDKVLQATAGDDALYGYDGNDTLSGLAGADLLFGFGGDDSLNGDDGGDWLYGGDGNDTLNGGAGNDTLNGDTGNDILNGGTGNDSLSGGAGDDTYLFASNDGQDGVGDYGGGMDTVKFTDVTAADVTVSRDPYNNLVFAYGNGSHLTVGSYFYTDSYRIEQFQFSDGTVWGSDDIKAKVLQATDGNDFLVGDDGGNDVLNGLAGNDTLIGLGGNDTLDGGIGDDTMRGGMGDDTYSVDSPLDVVFEYANQGNDSIFSSVDFSLSAGVFNVENLSLLAGATAAKTAVGNQLDNALTGNANNNNLFGGDGNDTLYGNDGNDSLMGGAGNDVLDGGLGTDVLKGGLGQDTFVFGSALGAGNKDVITDFNVTDDTIRLDHSVFTALTGTGALAAAEFNVIGNGAVADSTDHILYNTVSGGLFYDADGNGAGAAVLVALLGKGLAMTAADFMVV
ncbi:calcium-binding protein [Methylovulum psychrotolerans]|uniref:calcium-binding protein n=1 Tax=Methylovulum psychrotolerans TaxID=1704499 RepID=UPI001BFEF8A7|nr:calcium-binding protein [Methylovulum psychrotolerans]MBT9096234.1 calcium-binding protein [Methylovulum psychrotolerans]